MSGYLIVLLIVVVVAIAVVAQRTRSARLNIDDLQPGPIRHDKLDPELVDRIKVFSPIVADLYPQTLEQWIDGFRRDLNPESEVAIWENIANALATFDHERNLTIDARREAFALLLQRSGASDEEVLSGVELAHLTSEDARRLLRLYSSPPKPITFVAR